MTIEVCNAFLEALALLNEGSDHATEYTLALLPDAPSLNEALDLYFKQVFIEHGLTEHSWCGPLQLTPILGDWRLRLGEAVSCWFFDQMFSPKLQDEYQRSNTCDTFLHHLAALVKDAEVFEISADLPLWYACTWEDFAFVSGNRRYLLHLGFFT